MNGHPYYTYHHEWEAREAFERKVRRGLALRKLRRAAAAWCINLTVLAACAAAVALYLFRSHL